MSDSPDKKDLARLLVDIFTQNIADELDTTAKADAACTNECCVGCDCPTSAQCSPNPVPDVDCGFEGFVQENPPFTGQPAYFGDAIPEPLQPSAVDVLRYNEALVDGAIEALNTLSHLCASGTEDKALEAANALLGYHLAVLGV